MIILHCMIKETWKVVKDNIYFGQRDLERHGFIHCSSIEYFWRVASNFTDVSDELVLLCIDTNKLKSEIRWEDADNCGREYPHVYGLINTDSVVNVLPYIKNNNGDWIKNNELNTVPNK